MNRVLQLIAILQFDFMKQKQELNHVYIMYISLQSHYADEKMK